MAGDGGGAHGPGEADVPPERCWEHAAPHEAMVREEVEWQADEPW